MRLHYKGKFNGDISSLPHPEHKPNAVKFREPESPKKLGLIANGISIAVYGLTIAVLFLRGGFTAFNFFGCLAALLSSFPHEILHGLCFREDAYIYTNLKNGMLFVVGPEDMSKTRFVCMSLLPNLIFGFLPFALFLINPKLSFLGSLGAFAIPMGAGDYLNVFNALRQMPRNARTYLHGFNSWWYLPE